MSLYCLFSGYFTGCLHIFTDVFLCIRLEVLCISRIVAFLFIFQERSYSVRKCDLTICLPNVFTTVTFYKI